MAQKGSGKRKQAPAYSADAMAVRYMAGLVLIALGAMIFMAVNWVCTETSLRVSAGSVSVCAEPWPMCSRYCRSGPACW